MQKMFLADFWGTPTLRGKTHQTVFDPFPVWMFFYSPGVWERWKTADAPKKSERVVWEWYWYEAHSERVVTNHRLESDIGVMEKGCGCYYTSCAKIFCTICYIFCTICYICAVYCVLCEGERASLTTRLVGWHCGLWAGVGFPCEGGACHMIPLSVTETSNLTKPREDATQKRLIFIGICKRPIKYFALLFLLYLDCNCTSVFLNYLIVFLLKLMNQNAKSPHRPFHL